MLPDDLLSRALEAAQVDDNVLAANQEAIVGRPVQERSDAVSQSTLDVALFQLNLHAAAQGERSSVLTFLSSNPAKLHHFGGVSAAEDAISAVEEVGRWLP